MSFVCLTPRASVAAASAVLGGPARRLPRKRRDGSVSTTACAKLGCLVETLNLRARGALHPHDLTSSLHTIASKKLQHGPSLRAVEVHVAEDRRNSSERPVASIILYRKTSFKAATSFDHSPTRHVRLTGRASVATASAVLGGPARRLPRKRRDGSVSTTACAS